MDKEGKMVTRKKKKWYPRTQEERISPELGSQLMNKKVRKIEVNRVHSYQE